MRTASFSTAESSFVVPPPEEKMDITDKYIKKMANIAEIQRNKPILLKGGPSPRLLPPGPIPLPPLFFPRFHLFSLPPSMSRFSCAVKYDGTTKRFFEKVGVQEMETGFAVTLGGRRIGT
jgi:hypothetical protein